MYINYLVVKAKEKFKENNKVLNFCKKKLLYEKNVKEAKELYE